ncbi:ATP-binding protein [Actinomycetospora rhizophila]|uniref:ATP-binding protein n=1 Tax=Actinomycetospora rhizophila TaxID=1416876 RepID=A0ABV9ZGT8_9PSEU
MGPSLLCPALVGREDETAALREHLAAAERGRGGVVLLVGEPGVGKSRLLRDATDVARGLGLRVLAGRAVPGGSPVPHRPLTEAFLAAYRSAPPPTGPELDGFAGHLARLVPPWRGAGPAAVDDSPVVMGEAVLRLLRSGGAAVLALEDLHWADTETLAVLDHLVDALAEEPVLVVGTMRPEGAVAELRARLARRAPANVLAVDPLDGAGVDRMLAACLATPDPPAGVRAFLARRAEGVPLLVEELLAGLVAADELRFEHDHWVGAGELTPRVPASLRESVARRAEHLDPVARRVLAAAAVLGRRFDWELVPGIAEVDGRATVDGLRAAVAQHLVEVDGGGFAFRHALTREAVLDDLLPPERRELAQRAWPAVERAYPGLPGALCELAAELAEAAGAPVEAAARLVTAARRALAAGAVASAEVTARRAQRLAGADDRVVGDVDEVLVDVLVAAGKPREALELGHDLVARTTDPDRRLGLLLVLTRAAVGAGEVAEGARLLDLARAAADGRDLPALDAVAAHVALEQGRHGDAAALAHRVIDAATEPAVECEALEVLGRVEREFRAGSAVRWLARASEVAERAGLATWHLRAQQELALITWDTDALRATRALAARHGALTTVAVMDLSLADLALGHFDTDGALAASRACADASRRYGLATAAVAHLWLAGAHALAGDDAAMEAAIAQALAPDPTDPRILGDLHGRVLATRCLVADELGALRGHLDTMMTHVRAADPARSVFPGRALWALLHTIEDDDLGVAARAEFGEVAARIGLDLFRYAHTAAEAVALGRTGAGPEATALLTAARPEGRALEGGVGLLHCVQLLTAQAAVRDGWGDPATWLRESEAFFAEAGHARPARRCRIVLGRTGAPVPRRGRGGSVVPAPLRALGVTSREMDVLGLVALGLSTPEIGARLVLSPRTVERHLGNLFARTGLHDRRALAELARRHGVQGG